MTDVSLEVLNRRTAVNAVHAAAAGIGADADTLLDSQAFYDRVTSLDPDSPGYRRRVQEMVAGAAGHSAPPRQTAPPVRSSGEHNTAPGGQRQWTLDDVDKSTPAELTVAMNAGLLRDLGYAPPRGRRR